MFAVLVLAWYTSALWFIDERAGSRTSERAGAGATGSLAVLSWVVAAVLVVMLLIGPQVIAEDEPKPTTEAAGSSPYASGSGGAADGESVFVDSCGSCHTLEAAGTSGQVGPSARRRPRSGARTSRR